MNLLLVTSDFPPSLGGVQTYSFELSKRFAVDSERFSVIAPHAAGCEAFDRRLPFRVFRVRGGANLFPLLATMRVARLGRRGGFDAAFCASWQSAMPVVLARPFGGPTRLFAAAHGRELLFNPFGRIGFLRRLYDGRRKRILGRSARRVFAVSRYSKALVVALGVPSVRVAVQTGGTDPERFFPAGAAELRQSLELGEGPVILSVARLVRRKGLHAVVRALPAVLREVPDAVYVIVGEGPERGRLHRLATDLNLQNHVRFEGSVGNAELPEYYRLCDVFVLPAEEEFPDVEGFGLVFLEAGACGKPVIGAKTGGIPDAVLEGETGILVEPDDIAALAAAIRRVLGDRNLAERLGRAGRLHVERSANWDSVARRLTASMREASDFF